MQILSSRFHLKGEANSMQGGRPENQDNFGFQDTPLGFLIVVCDGMGGGPAGKLASTIVVQQILAYVSHSSADASRTEVLKQAVAHAEEALQEQMKHHPEQRGMGTTMVAVLINEKSAVVAHLGDSRIYRISGKKVMHRTEDHSLVAQLVRNKTLTEEQARTSPQSNIILRAFGSTENHVADMAVVPYRRGDRFILCTDGVWGIMPHEQLLSRLTANDSVTSIATNLSAEIDKIGFAAGGGHDNHTLAIIETETDSILKDKMNTQAKIIIAVLAGLLAISLLLNLIHLFGSNDSNDNDQNAQLKAQIASLQGYKMRYDSLVTANLADYSSELEWLMLKDKEQEDSIIGLNEKVAALNAKLQNAQEQKAVAAITKPAGAMTPKGYALNIVENLEKMKQVKTKGDPKEAVHQKDAYRKQVLELLDLLDNATDGLYKTRTNAIRNTLNDKTDSKGRITSPPCMAITGDVDKEGYHYSPASSNKHIDTIITKVKELVKTLK